MVDLTRIAGLIEQLEAATDGNPELDAYVGAAVRRAAAAGQESCVAAYLMDADDAQRRPGAVAVGCLGWHIVKREGDRVSFARPLPYTTSLDAALTLIPQGWRVANAEQGTPVQLWQWTLERASGHDTVAAASLRAPLALCVAALKAWEAETEHGRGSVRAKSEAR